ncbi:hypothetical protein V1264_009419 [Littorina saxatilis]|uniref:G-protein coupled receptors family 1 profile domain-containing protein n=1 Tax=Littorina saxatilis TaxID=31220 RepID=A0AAN9ARD6_9CAEN
MKVLNSVGTVRGAKIACAVCFSVALVISFPAIAFYGSSDGVNILTNNITNTSASTEHQHCFQICMDSVHEDYKKPLKALLSFYFLVFAVLAAAMIVLYSATIRRLWQQRKEDISDMRTRRQSSVFVSGLCRPSSVFVSRRSGSLGTLCEAVHKAVLDSKRQVVRTMSEGDAVGKPTGDAQPEIHSRSVSNPCNNTDKGCIMSKLGDAVAINPEGKSAGGAQPEIHPRSDSSPRNRPGKGRIMPGMTRGVPRLRCESDPSRSEANESKQPTMFPPVSYTAQLRSMMSLNVAKRLEEEQDSVLSRQASVSSFQFRKYGNRARETTIVFVLITAIYILSYLPYFIVVIYQSQNPGMKRTALDELFLKSYLISNAANPLIYGLCNPYFRITLWKLLVCRREVL